MGQQPSKDKRTSNASSITLLPTTSSPGQSSSPSSPKSPSDIITQPAPPRHLHRISEIIDPRSLINDICGTTTRGSRPGTASSNSKLGVVHSPSGNALAAHEFIAHPHRPLAMWERQERVLQATREEVERFEAASRAGTRAGFRSDGGGGRVRKRRCCGCYFWGK